MILKLVHSMTEQLVKPPAIFEKEIMAHYAEKGDSICERLERFCNSGTVRRLINCYKIS